MSVDPIDLNKRRTQATIQRIMSEPDDGLSAGPELQDWAKHPLGQTPADPLPETAMIERLWVALESYAVHHANCYGDKTCTCGLKKLLSRRPTQPSIEPRNNRPSDSPSSMAAGPCVPEKET